MKISVVIPSFNQAEYLDAAIRSVIEQPYEEKEILVMDGGSVDGSVEIIRRYQSNLTFWRSAPDGGQAKAIADGFALTTGEIIGWLNSDDTLAAGALDRISRMAARAGTTDSVFYGGHEVIDKLGDVQEVFYPPKLVAWVVRAIGPAFICQPGTFFGRQLFYRAGGININLRYSMDFDLWMRFFLADARFVKIDRVQAQFRRHSFQKGHREEWLAACDSDERELRRRYDLASIGSLKWFMARQLQRLISVVTGNLFATLAYRLFRRRRIREYAVQYSN